MAVLLWLFFAGLIVAPVLCAIGAISDMNDRAQPGWLYGLFIFFCFPVGLGAWVYGRSRYPVVDAFRPALDRRGKVVAVTGGAITVGAGVVLLSLGVGAAGSFAGLGLVAVGALGTAWLLSLERRLPA